ncbi:MAG: thymidylate synthase [Thaumarchaeota archaeon]|nr:thymidylate synthase [Nitrososphaerota archaeon]
MNADQTYINLVNNILEYGVKKTDRTGTGTISLPFQQMRFDLTDNKIPLLTTKKMFTKGIIHEILWYLMSSANSKYLQDRGVSIWNEWSTPEGHLNKVYGFQWRKWECYDWIDHVVEVPIKTGGVNEPFQPPKAEWETWDEPTSDKWIGGVLYNNKGKAYTIVRKVPNQKKNSHYLIQFHDTRSTIVASLPNIRRGQVRDPYAITVFNQGCIGVYAEKHPYRTAAYNLWYNMMRRCYDPSLPEYQLYGGVGIFVDQSWRCFSNFLRDIHDVVYFTSWKDAPSRFDLDKDYFGATCYSKDTCIFLPKKYNQVLPKLDGSKIVAVNKHTNQKFEFTVQRWFARQHGIKHSQAISTALLQSPTSSTKDWAFEKIQPKEGFLFRQRFFVDQVAEAIHKLRTNPTDRRIIISAWNVAEISKMRLPPCHAMFQFWSDGQGGLSCHLYQRSCDVGLGVPFNIVQYAILTHMFAHVTGHTAKEFVWTGGDVHIYNNHIDAIKEQTTRVPYASPTLILNSNVKEIDDFKYEDFQIVGYQHHPVIKMEVSV